MPNKCSAPNCTSNYYPSRDPYVPVFKLPSQPPELRQEWIKALHRENITDLQHIFVCVNHFREEDIERAYKVPNPDGTFQEIPRGHPSILPGSPSYYSAPVPMHRLSLEAKEADQFTKVIQLSRISHMEDTERNSVTTLKELKLKLSTQNLPTNWLSWCPTDDELHFISLSKTHRPISVSSSLTIDSTLNVIAYHGEETVTLSLAAINDIRQIELLLSEISIESKVLSSSNPVQLHITKACKHINGVPSLFF